jgi:hypothetical protein
MFGRVRRLQEALQRKADRVRELREHVLKLERREQELRIDVEKLRTEILEVRTRAAIAQNNFEWARVRLNQVEQERATLIATMLKAPIGALEIDRRLTPDQGSGMPKLPDALFEDIGDDAARVLGIDYDGDEVTHG